MREGITKALVFAALLLFFYLLGGFDFSTARETLPALQRWELQQSIRSMVLFCAGAAIATWGDKRFGIIDPTSLRWCYIVGGIVLMLIGLLWSRSAHLLSG